MCLSLQEGSVMGLYQISRSLESNFGLEMAPIISNLHKPSAVSVRSSRSGSSRILVRMATTLLPPCAFNSFCVRVAPFVVMSESSTDSMLEWLSAVSAHLENQIVDNAKKGNKIKTIGNVSAP